MNSSYIQGLNWTTDLSDLQETTTKQIMNRMLHTMNYEGGNLEQWDPMAFAAKANDADTPTWNEAMNGPFAEGFWEACKKELTTLINMGVWEVVDRESWMEVIPMT